MPLTFSTDDTEFLYCVYIALLLTSDVTISATIFELYVGEPVIHQRKTRKPLDCSGLLEQCYLFNVDIAM